MVGKGGFLATICDVTKQNILEVGKRHVAGYRLFLYFQHRSAIIKTLVNATMIGFT